MRRYNQLDLIKGIATIMVLINHSLNFAYEWTWLFELSRTCVALFIIAAGVSLYISFDRYLAKGNVSFRDVFVGYIFKSIVRVFVPYSVYVVVFSCLLNRRFDLQFILDKLFKFNINNPCYYFVIYISLIIITPLCYYIIESAHKYKVPINYFACIAFVLACGAFGFFSVKYTFVMDVFKAGKYLFGGTYLPLYAIGLLVGKHLITARQPDNKAVKLKFAISSALLVVWFSSLILLPKQHQLLEYGLVPVGGNPPGSSIIIESLIVFFFLWSMYDFTVLITKEKFKWSAIVAVGKVSIYIFLYHQIIKYIMLQIINSNGFPKVSVMNGIVFYLCSTVVVILAVQLYRKLCDDIKRVFAQKNKSEE